MIVTIRKLIEQALAQKGRDLKKYEVTLLAKKLAKEHGHDHGRINPPELRVLRLLETGPKYTRYLSDNGAFAPNRSSLVMKAMRKKNLVTFQDDVPRSKKDVPPRKYTITEDGVAVCKVFDAIQKAIDESVPMA